MIQTVEQHQYMPQPIMPQMVEQYQYMPQPVMQQTVEYIQPPVIQPPLMMQEVETTTHYSAPPPPPVYYAPPPRQPRYRIRAISKNPRVRAEAQAAINKAVWERTGALHMSPEQLHYNMGHVTNQLRNYTSGKLA
jgi:hypothetical protein